MIPLPDLLAVLAPPLAICVILAGVLCYYGVQVIEREVIFVDLALAQVAALGVAAGASVGLEPHTAGGYACSLLFAMAGAVLFTFARFRDRRVPQEAVIGIVYATATAASLLILSRIPIEQDEVEHMLVGWLLIAGWPEVRLAAAVGAVSVAIHVVAARVMGARADWPRDLVFYATLGLVVTTAVPIAGVLPVFSFLIVPAACAMTFFGSVRARLVAGWGFGLAGSGAGLAVSVLGDVDTGASVVAALGALFAGCMIVAGLGHLR